MTVRTEVPTPAARGWSRRELGLCSDEGQARLPGIATRMTRDDRPDGDTPEQAPVELDRLIIRSVGWLGFALGSRQGVSFFTTLLLARLLTPGEFGLVALAATFLVFLEPLQDSGLAAALVYRRDNVERAAGSVLVYAPLVAAGLFVVGFVAAPYFGRAFHEPDVTPVIRALLVLVIIRSF